MAGRQWLSVAAVVGSVVLAAQACAPGAQLEGSGGRHSTGGSTATGTGGDIGVGAGTSSSSGTLTGSGGTGGGGAGAHCDPTSPDLAECSCGTPGATRSCYPADINQKTRGVGECHDGTQTCGGAAEFNVWSACALFFGPQMEHCIDGLDNNCDGLVDCMDPTCASAAACNTGCADGDTRACYDGPPGTENTGICHPGTQTCVNGTWSAGCNGEQTPTAEVCTDLGDHNCNGLPGCFDFFSCIFDPACAPPPCMPANGCTCPMGFGDEALCPNGDFGDPVTGMCCPCSASTCNQAGCCGEAACKNAAVCGGLTCAPLDPSCNGMVAADCDFEDLASADAQNPPEDCDMLCCKCKPTNYCPP